MTDLRKRLGRDALARLVGSPVDIASLAAFRFCFGLLMAFAMIRFLAKGWVGELYVRPAFHFTYPGFDWVRPLPDVWMHAHFILLALLAVGVAVGCFYRVCITLFLLGFAYVELLDQTTYLNHYYFISLVSGLMIFLPAHRAWSVDAFRRPAIRLAAVPSWTLNILRFQTGVVYFFAGVAKVNADWLFHAQPLRIWLAARSDLPLAGPFLSEPWVAYAASWTGALYDLSIAFLLLNRRTRGIAYVAVILFHVATWLLFNIGMFPWIMMVTALIFFPPDWPRRLCARLGSMGTRMAQFTRRFTELPAPEDQHGATRVAVHPLTVALLSAYLIVQLVLPLRPYLVRERSAWTCDGFNLAWQVMIVEKTGLAEFFAEDPTTGTRWKLPARDYLTPRQEVMMAQDPYLVRALARRLAADLRRQGYANIQVKVNAYASLNGRPSQPLIKPDVDLAASGTSEWIVPLEQ